MRLSPLRTLFAVFRDSLANKAKFEDAHSFPVTAATFQWGRNSGTLVHIHLGAHKRPRSF